ncbi:MAG: IS1 family transposase [Hymenobacter sp.]|nr:MAG: IS1 family transposase [Hymenobacter sp.]
MANLAKKARAISFPLPRLRRKKTQKKRWEALELDKMWSFVGSKAYKAWLWLAVERASRRIVAWVVGGRSAQRLWGTLPRRYRRHCWYFTDLWDAYGKVLPC